MHRSRGLLAALAAAMLWAGAAAAQGVPAGDAESPGRAHAGGIWDRDALTGDWGGLRSHLEAQGLQLGAAYTGEVLGNPTGGERQGTIAEGELALSLDVDLAKAIGWAGGRFHVSSYWIQGSGLSAQDLGNNFLTASSIEARSSERLYDLWLQQDFFGGTAQVRIGQIAADDEFFLSQYAAGFVNSTFGWPAILATNLPSGGPAYPLATPGVRIRVTPTDRLSFAIAAFDGDPAGPGPGDPQVRDPSGTSFRVDDSPFTIAEAAYALNQEKNAPGLPGTYKLGAWYHFGRFADQRFATNGVSLAAPTSSGVPAERGRDFGVYAIADQMVWRESADANRGLGVFLRLGLDPSDRNQIAYYGDAGVSYSGLFPGRDADVLGLGFAYARISADAAALDRDAGQPLRDFESVVELTYSAQVAPWWTVQPDLQYIIHPGAGAVNPTLNRPLPDAFVIGMRSAVTF